MTEITRFFVTEHGEYLGAFTGIPAIVGVYANGIDKILEPEDFPEVPAGAIQVTNAPSDSRQKWDFENKIWLPLA